MSDSSNTVVSTYTTTLVVAIVVPVVITVIGLAVVFAYKRRREREFVPPSLANMTGNNTGNLPTTTPALPVQVRHVRNVRNATLLEWPSPNSSAPNAFQQGPGTQPPSDPAGGTINVTQDPEAARNVRPDLLPTPYHFTYSGAQPTYPAQDPLPVSISPSFPSHVQPLLPPTQRMSAHSESWPIPLQSSFMPLHSHPPVPAETAADLASPQAQRAVHPRVLMLVNDDASRSTSPSQATDDSSTLRGTRSMGSFSTVGEPVPQYEAVDSAVLTEEPEQVADLQRLGRQGTMLPRYSQTVSQTNPFRRPSMAAGPAQ